MHTQPTDLSNRELLERIVGDLNELIDKRGNTQLIPTLIEMKGLHDEIVDLERLIYAMQESYLDDADRGYTDEWEPLDG